MKSNGMWSGEEKIPGEAGEVVLWNRKDLWHTLTRLP